MNEIVETTKRRCKGRESALTPDRVTVIRQRLAGGEQKAALARKLKISRQTLDDGCDGTDAGCGVKCRLVLRRRRRALGAGIGVRTHYCGAR